MSPERNGWTEAELYVTKELERLSKQVNGLDEKITNLRVDMAGKSAVWGAVSGAVTGIVFWLLKGKV